MQKQPETNKTKENKETRNSQLVRKEIQLFSTKDFTIKIEF